MSGTAADAAELDVLLHALSSGCAEHRENCRACQPCAAYEAWKEHVATCPACQGYAPLTYGLPCEKPHNGWTCPACNPCPHLQAAIREVVDWFEARRLLSHAQALRAQLEERAA